MKAVVKIYENLMSVRQSIVWSVKIQIYILIFRHVNFVLQIAYFFTIVHLSLFWSLKIFIINVGIKNSVFIVTY